jgi:putative intracellular protease/amidase
LFSEPEFRTDLTVRPEKDVAAEAQLDRIVRLESVEQEDSDTAFYPGGHGRMWDFDENKHSIEPIEPFLTAGKTNRRPCRQPEACRVTPSRV